VLNHFPLQSLVFIGEFPSLYTQLNIKILFDMRISAFLSPRIAHPSKLGVTRYGCRPGGLGPSDQHLWPLTHSPTWTDNAIRVTSSWHDRNIMTNNLNNNMRNKRFNWGLLKLTRHSLALLGLLSLASVLFFASQPAWRLSASLNLLSWLDSRQDGALDIYANAPVEPFVPSMDAAGQWALSDEQEAVTRGLSRRYKLSPEPLGSLVSEAWALGDRIQVSPTLLLAVIAIESRFNPFASGTQGGMGLMQIEPQAQHLALLPFGGPLAAFDPLTNLRVGAQHLQTLLAQSASVEAALLLYAAASGQRNGAEYTHRVLAEQKLLENMAHTSKRIEVAQNSRLQTRPPLN
jgi:hypothetical protein